MRVAPAGFWFRSAAWGLKEASGPMPMMPMMTRCWMEAGVQAASSV